MFSAQFHAVSFVEHPVVDHGSASLHRFDIAFYDADFIHAGEFSIKNYCRALLNKLCSLDRICLRPFMEYQAASLLDPLAWLNSLEQLLEDNVHLFDSRELELKLYKIAYTIEIVRHELEQGRRVDASGFDFDKVLKQIAGLPLPQKLEFLHNIRAQYLQRGARVADTGVVPFDRKIEIEIEKITRLDNDLSALQKLPVAGAANSLKDKYMDNEELLLALKMSKRKAQALRDSGQLPYTMIGAQVYYLREDVEKLLQKNYRKKKW